MGIYAKNNNYAITCNNIRHIGPNGHLDYEIKQKNKIIH